MGTFIDTVTRTGGTVLDLLRRFSFKDFIDLAIVGLLYLSDAAAAEDRGVLRGGRVVL